MKFELKKYPLLIPSIAISIMLFLAIPNLFHYSYYWGLKWMVTASSIYFFYQAYIKKCTVLLPLFVIVGMLFNPVFPVHLGKVYWMIIDFITGLVFLLSNLIIKKGKKNGK